MVITCPNCNTTTDVNFSAIADHFAKDNADGSGAVFCSNCGGQLPHPEYGADAEEAEALCPCGTTVTALFGYDVNLLLMDQKDLHCPSCGIAHDTKTWKFL